VIPLFVGYALLVWYPAAHWRRRVLGFVAVTLGVVGLFGALLVHAEVGRKFEIYFPVFQSILIPYILLVAGVGYSIACMPRVARPGRCICGYDIQSPGEPLASCPECGRRMMVEMRDDGACASCGFAGVDPYLVTGDCPSCGALLQRSRTSRVRARQAGEWGGEEITAESPRVSPR